MAQLAFLVLGVTVAFAGVATADPLEIVWQVYDDTVPCDTDSCRPPSRPCRPMCLGDEEERPPDRPPGSTCRPMCLPDDE